MTIPGTSGPIRTAPPNSNSQPPNAPSPSDFTTATDVYANGCLSGIIQHSEFEKHACCLLTDSVSPELLHPFLAAQMGSADSLGPTATPAYAAAIPTYAGIRKYTRSHADGLKN